ncbi:hypothetical protein MKX03_005598 [Papaver bracteatum]|nr:hypothetical protein MKX03_005598 [Papaver bracteatum]
MLILLELYSQNCDSCERDFIIWRNCMKRDFTINGLMLDPYANVVYDYVGGMEDYKKAKAWTMIPTYTSFQEDCGNQNCSLLRAPSYEGNNICFERLVLLRTET